MFDRELVIEIILQIKTASKTILERFRYVPQKVGQILFTLEFPEMIVQ